MDKFNKYFCKKSFKIIKNTENNRQESQEKSQEKEKVEIV